MKAGLRHRIALEERRQRREEKREKRRLRRELRCWGHRLASRGPALAALLRDGREG